MTMFLVSGEKNFLFDERELVINEVELLTLKISSEISTGRYIISVPTPKLLIPLAIEIFHLDYENTYKERQEISRRASIMIITNSLRNAKDFFSRAMISTEYVIRTSIQKQQFFLGKRDNFMNDRYNTQSYWKDYIYKRFKPKKIPEYLPYQNFFPVAFGNDKYTTVSRDYFGRYDDVQQPCYYFTSNPAILLNENVPRIDCALVDYTSINKTIYPALKNTPFVYYFDNLLDDRMLQNKKSSIFLCFDSPLISSISGKTDHRIYSSLSVHYDEMLEHSELGKIRVEYVVSGFEEQLENIFIRYTNSKDIPGLYKEKQLVGILIHSIISLPVNAVEYDSIAQKDPYIDSILDLLKELNKCDSLYNNIDLARCKELLEDIQRLLDVRCPKQEAIISLVDKSRKKGRKICIITGNKIMSIALKKFLSQKIGIDLSDLSLIGIDVLTFNKVKTLEKFQCDDLIITGCNNLRKLNILQKLKYDLATVLLYKAEIVNLHRDIILLESMAKESEPGYIKAYREVNNINEYIQTYTYLKNRLKVLFLDETLLSIYDFGQIMDSKSNKISLSQKKTYAINTIAAKSIVFDDGSFYLSNVNSMLSVLSPGGQLYEMNITELESGFDLILVDGEVHHDIYLSILKKMHLNSKYILYLFWVEKWQETLEDEVLARDLNYLDVAKEMKNRGWNKDYKNVKNWIEKKIMGPDNPNDIKLLGEILGVKFFQDNYNEIYEALEKIRLLHRLISKMLNKIIIAAQNKKFSTQKISALSDYGISIDDIRDAVQIKTIDYICNETYYVKNYELGKIYESDEVVD